MTTDRHRRDWRGALRAPVVLALLLAASCGMSREERPLVVGFGDHPVTLDPHLHNNNLTWSVLSSFFDSLVEFTPEMGLQPALAERWEQTGPTSWRFEVRSGAPFHGGGTLQPEDVVASYERVRSHPRSPLRYLLAGISRVTVVDAHAVAVETDRPMPDLANRLAFLAIIPRRLALQREIATPDGTGAYRFVGRTPAGAVEAEAFSGWRGKPPIRRVSFVFDESAQASASRFLAGNVDVCHSLPEEVVGEVRKIPGLRAEAQASLGVQLLAVYPANAGGAGRRALADPRVRRALLLALDRQGWVDRLLRGQATVASQYVHPVVFGHDPNLAPLPHDTQQARTLLADAGHGAGFDVVLGHTRSGAAVAAAIAADLARVGVRVQLLAGSAAELADFATSGRISLQLFQWACGTGDAGDFLDRFVPAPGERADPTRLGFWGTSDPRLEAIVAAAAGEVDPERRRVLLQSAQREMLRTLPMLPLTLRSGHRGVSARVEVVDRYDEREIVADFRWRR